MPAGTSDQSPPDPPLPGRIWPCESHYPPPVAFFSLSQTEASVGQSDHSLPLSMIPSDHRLETYERCTPNSLACIEQRGVGGGGGGAHWGGRRAPTRRLSLWGHRPGLRGWVEGGDWTGLLRPARPQRCIHTRPQGGGVRWRPTPQRITSETGFLYILGGGRHSHGAGVGRGRHAAEMGLGEAKDQRSLEKRNPKLRWAGTSSRVCPLSSRDLLIYAIHKLRYFLGVGQPQPWYFFGFE